MTSGIRRIALPVVLLGAAWTAAALPSIGVTSVNPASGPVGVANPVLVTAIISDASLIPGSVILQRLDSNGIVIGTLGNLKDDGLNVDTAAGDTKYTIKLSLFDTKPGTVNLRVAASFRGLLRPVFSAPFVFSYSGSTAVGVTIDTPRTLRS